MQEEEKDSDLDENLTLTKYEPARDTMPNLFQVDDRKTIINSQLKLESSTGNNTEDPRVKRSPK